MPFQRADHRFNPRREGNAIRGEVVVQDDVLGSQVFRYRISGADFDDIMGRASPTAKAARLKVVLRQHLKERIEAWQAEETARRAEVVEELEDPGSINRL